MTSGISSLRILPREENGKENNREDEMLGLFLSMLDVRVQAIEANVGNDPHSQVILQELKAGISKLQAPGAGTPKLSNAAAWNEAYRLERLLAVVEPPETLTLDLDRRLNEAIANNLPAVERLKVDVSAAKSAAYDTSKQPPVLNPGRAEILRNSLNNLLEEIHWEDQRKFYAAPIQKTAVHRIVFLDLLVFVAVVIPYAWIYFRSFQNNIDLRFWASLPLYTVLTVGAFGAYFSRLIDILRRGDELSIRELQSSKMWSSLFLRGAVGMCGALIVFFFLKSGLITGGIFPEFSQFAIRSYRLSGLHQCGEGEHYADNRTEQEPCFACDVEFLSRLL